MRTPKLHASKNGEPFWRVRYRRDGRDHALTFWGDTAEADATEFAGLVNTLGADRAVAWWNAHLDREDTGMTLDEWFDRYVRALTGLTEGTRLTYERTYRRVWQKPLGAKPLAAILREDIAHVVNDLSERERKSDKTVRNAYGVISSCFKAAVRDGHLPVSPCLNIRLPRRTEHQDVEMRFLTHAEWADLAAALPTHYVPLFTMLIGTGMRWGEAEALTVADVVLEPNPVVRITKAAKWNASRATRDVGPTKTRKSRRTITLPPEVVDALLPLLNRPGRDRLFLAPKGGELRHPKVYETWLRAVAQAGLAPRPRIHDLRHTHVAWLVAAGIPLPVIQARLGHENISTTIDRYGHLLPDLQLAAANAASVAMQARPHLPAAGPAALPSAQDAGS